MISVAHASTNPHATATAGTRSVSGCPCPFVGWSVATTGRFDPDFGRFRIRRNSNYLRELQARPPPLFHSDMPDSLLFPAFAARVGPTRLLSDHCAE